MGRAKWFLRGAGIALLGFLAAAVLAAPGHTEGNPDGPVGSVMFEPSVTLGGWHNFERVRNVPGLWMPKPDDDEKDEPEPEDPVPPRRLPYPWDVEHDTQTYQLRVLMPVSASWSLGAAGSYTNADWQERSTTGHGSITTAVDGWSLTLRARYWWHRGE